jgi:hypothetical protein
MPANRRNNSRRNSRTRRNRGVFSTVYSPVSGLLHTAKNIAGSGLNSAYAVPATFVKGAKNTVRNSVGRLVEGVDNIGKKTFSGVDRALSGAFSRKNRKNMHQSRKNSRK